MKKMRKKILNEPVAIRFRETIFYLNVFSVYFEANDVELFGEPDTMFLEAEIEKTVTLRPPIADEFCTTFYVANTCYTVLVESVMINSNIFRLKGRVCSSSIRKLAGSTE
jgi:hypothetical protein